MLIIAPEYKEYFHARGDVLHYLGEHLEAIESYEVILEEGSRDPQIHAELYYCDKTYATVFDS